MGIAHNGRMTAVTFDARSRAVLPGHAGETFAVQENADGSILLQPATVEARVITAAQAEYDSNPQLQALLTRAAGAGTVRRARSRR